MRSSLSKLRKSPGFGGSDKPLPCVFKLPIQTDNFPDDLKIAIELQCYLKEGMS